VLILERGDGESRGSARSIDGFNIVEALAECGDLLRHYGGHAKAAGLTVANEHLESLHARLLALATARLSAEQLRPTLRLDLELPATPAALSSATVDALARLEPCGHGNPEPLLLLRDVAVRWPRRFGDGKHLSFSIPLGRREGMRAVAFGQGDREGEVRRAGKLDLAGSLRRDWWQGEERLEFHVRDFRSAARGSGTRLRVESAE
jgi:single-stranded-DNA-specific exonuclease